MAAQAAPQRRRRAPTASAILATLGGERLRSTPITGEPSLTSLPLQMLIVANAPFSLAWGAVWISLHEHKFAHWRMDLITRYLTLLLFAIWAITEPLRLYLGASGNRGEKAAGLVAFLLMTLLPQGLCILVLMSVQRLVFPWEIVSAVIMFAFLVAEAGLALGTARALIRRSTAEFRLQRDEDLTRRGL